jgi:hypothetical protein
MHVELKKRGLSNAEGPAAYQSGTNAATVVLINFKSLSVVSGQLSVVPSARAKDKQAILETRTTDKGQGVTDNA